MSYKTEFADFLDSRAYPHLDTGMSVSDDKLFSYLIKDEFGARANLIASPGYAKWSNKVFRSERGWVKTWRDILKVASEVLDE